MYGTQDELPDAEHVAARDTIVSLAPFMNSSDSDSDPSRAEARDMKGKIEVLQGQLLLVESLMVGLDKDYKKFLAAHPER